MADITVTADSVAVVNPALAEIVPMIAVETITKGQPVYQTAAGKAGVADANAAGKQQFRGIALNKAGAGAAVNVLKRGQVYGFDLSGLNYDAAVYLSDTVGALADGAGTMTVIAGRVMAMTDSALTKVLYVDADWLRAWS